MPARRPASSIAGSASRLGRPVRSRRGSVKAGVVMALIGGAVTGGALVAVRPRAGNGSEPGAPVLDEPRRQLEFDGLTSLLQGSAAVLSVRVEEGRPLGEVLIHVADGPRRGQVEPGELLLLTHLRSLDVLVASTLDPEAASSPATEDVIPRAQWMRPGFARAWRDREGVDVQREVIARGLSGFDLAPIDRPGTGERRPWRLTLTWDDGTADGLRSASVDLDLVVPDPSAME